MNLSLGKSKEKGKIEILVTLSLFRVLDWEIKVFQVSLFMEFAA